MTEPHFSVAVFPFLKTSAPVEIGGYIFRSTTDTADLPEPQAKAVLEIAEMLFLQGNLRIKSASYAIVPFVDFDRQSPDLERLARLRLAVAYFYAAPHDVFDTVFLDPEEASLVVFSPKKVSVYLARPDHHTELVSAQSLVQADERHELPGYAGLYNFAHHFWLEPGSRLYGPKPHISLIIAQDLAIDFQQRIYGRPDYHLLFDLLDKQTDVTTTRIFVSLQWFNDANENAAKPDKAVLCLAIAFEALLQLPESSKTERLVDAIALLLGRTDRLTDWAQQFYEARSRIAHEGRAKDLLYYIPSGSKQFDSARHFGSLMLYGRDIFRLCLATLLVGVDLAQRANLKERFISNGERFTEICKALNQTTVTPANSLKMVTPLVQAIKRYRFVASAAIPRSTMIGAVKLAANTLINSGSPLEDSIREALLAVTTAEKHQDDRAALEAINNLDRAFKNTRRSDHVPEEQTVRDLVEAAWGEMFSYYYSLTRS